MTRTGLIGSIISLVLLFVLSASIAFPKPWNTVADLGVLPHLPDNGFRLGLDLQGGVHLVYEADMSLIEEGERGTALDGVRDVIERRVNLFGVSEPVVQTNRSGGSERVIVELAGVFDVNEAIALIGETPILEFKVPATNLQTELTEEQELAMEEAQKGERASAEEVLASALEAEDFASFRAEFTGREVAVRADDEVFGLLINTIVKEKQRVGVVDGVYESGSDLFVVKYVGVQEIEGEDVYILDYIRLPLTTASDVLSAEGWENTGLSGKQVRSASVAFDPQTSMPLVALNFNGEGSDLFADLTEANVGGVIGIFLDGEPISTPVVQQAIYGGEATITGNFTLPEAKLLAQRLNAGALPVPVELVSQQTVGPTLGAVSLDRSVNASLVGFALVALFMLVYYRLPGLVSVLALATYASINLALYKMLGVTLSLASIAGFILSLGIAVDANVLIFERLKEELKSGRDLATAIDEGFRRAWSSIRDGNVTTLIASIVLFSMSTSFVKGFALTLGMGILVSMFTAIVVTRIVLKILAEAKWFQKSWLYTRM